MRRVAGIAMYSVYNHTATRGTTATRSSTAPPERGHPTSASSARSRSAGWPFEFTNLLVARDLNKCAVEQSSTSSSVCRRRDHQRPVLLRVEENRFWLARRQRRGAMGARRGLPVGPRRDDQGDRRGPVQVQGPKSKDVMVDLFGDSILEIPYYYLRPVRDRRNEGARLAHRLHGRARLRDLPVRGQQERGQAVGGRARGGQAARARGDRTVPHPPHRGVPRLGPGCDMWYDTNPTRWAWATTGWSTSSGHRLHRQEALHKIKEEGPKRKLVGVEIGGEQLGSYNDGSMIDVFPVHKDGSRIGKVTSACFSPRLEKNIGYAMVPTEQSEPARSSRSSNRRDDLRGRGREAVHRPEEGDAEAGARRELVSEHYDFVIVGGARRAARSPTGSRRTRPTPCSCWRRAARTTRRRLHPHAGRVAFPIGSRFYDWKYESEPEPYMGGRRVYHARAARCWAGRARSTG